jgi:Protein of unknown function (DUF1592)/Protein of unknown function (DUF1588)/Protein of unknown function (DUF1595)/Protein of unknown function (DUF1585)/Protein of unknown function (DUF1587)
MAKAKLFTCGTLICLSFAGMLAAAGAPADSGANAAAATPIKVAFRRITESEYRHIIADVFGPGIKIEARFEPEKREDGLLAVGDAALSLTSSGFEQYFALATSISDQALSESRRAALIGCAPANPTQADEACARQFIEKYGELLFRRPLNASEAANRLKAASFGAKQSTDFYAGLKLALTSLLVAPEFLFRIEIAEPDPANPGQYRLDGYTKAARLSFLLWDTSPDQELLDAARSGAIHTDAGLKKQLTRLISSPRFEDGARSFLADVLQLDEFANLTKDPAIYPKFNQSVSDAAREQMLKTSIELLVHKKQDYRDLFTSNETFINRPLAAVYRVPFASTGEWTSFTFPQSSERSGIFSEIGFLSLYAHPGTSSPTRRGIKVLEIFMCQTTPNPPANVDFSKVQDSTKGTVRGRLLDHMNNEGCAGCHRRTDPIGLSLEHFDGLGQLRTTENGSPIDVSADLKDAQFVGAQGLGKFLHDDPRVPACLVRDVYSYGTGNKTYGRDEPFIAAQTKVFASNGYRLPDLMMQLASSAEFFKVVVPKGAPPVTPATTARVQNSEGVVR